MAVIDRTDGLAAILEDQTPKSLVLRRAEEVAKAFGDTVSLQVSKFVVESELFLESVDGVGRSP